ncbi:MAG: competence protein ComEC, partial [Hyphomicrobiales bacterium]|nr:competence protein ComEC [Hyphomicrobiales bacterium]
MRVRVGSIVLGGLGVCAARVPWRARLARAFAAEVEARRIFLWTPVAAGAGIALYFAADVEPTLWLPITLVVSLALAAFLARARPLAFPLLVGAAALFAGFLSAELRSLRVAAPRLEGVRFLALTGTVEEIDFRRAGARMILRVDGATGDARGP